MKSPSPIVRIATTFILSICVAALAAANPISERGLIGGLIVIVLAFIAVVELVVIVVEALVYRWLLKRGFWNALAMSFLANAASFVVGLLILPLPKLPFASFVLWMLVLAILVEVPVLLLYNLRHIRRTQSEENGRLRMVGRIVWVCVVANLITGIPLQTFLGWRA